MYTLCYNTSCKPISETTKSNGLTRSLSRKISVKQFKEVLLLRGLQLDVARQQVWVDGVLRPEALTVHECKLLQALAKCHGEISPRTHTIQQVYGTPYFKQLDDDRLDALVERTRKKIEDNPRRPRFLRTIHGRGHRLDEYTGERT